MNYGCTGKSAGAQHSQTPESWVINLPGIKIVSPSGPSDAIGLLRSSLKDGNTVLFLEHKQLYALSEEIIDKGMIPIGKAEVRKEGRDITVAASSLMLLRCLEAAKKLEESGISVEVIDLRTIRPFDRSTLTESVQKTGRFLVVEETPELGGWGAHILAAVAEDAFKSLKAPPSRLAEPDMPIPAMRELEEQVIPSVGDIVKKIQRMMPRE
jgi:pyruvate dehydrogenase E1 component beta subunit